MNCCDAAGNCTQGPDCPARPASCDSLGVCQDRKPSCKDCHPVKPGTPSEGTTSAQVIWQGLKDRALSFPRAK